MEHIPGIRVSFAQRDLSCWSELAMVVSDDRLRMELVQYAMEDFIELTMHVHSYLA